MFRDRILEQLVIVDREDVTRPQGYCTSMANVRLNKLTVITGRDESLSTSLYIGTVLVHTGTLFSKSY